MIDAVQVGDLRFAESKYGPGEFMREHAHPEACVTLVLRGHIEERVARRAVSIGAASIGIKPFRLEHSDRFGPRGTHTLKLKMGPDFVARLEEFARPLERWSWVPLGAATPVLLRMRAWLRGRRRGGPADRLEDLAIELLAALQEDDRLREHSAAPPWLTAVRCEVVGRFRDGVRTRELASQAGVHPVYLARAFRRSYGESITECVRRLRVQEAARLLHDATGSVSGAAYRSGFADQSHLNRAFRRETGLTPGIWQAL